jgi:demethylmenaquinone methyltransferase/2-methoxy-6-polyprenyl-1,4-benzoquinol methylase
VQVIGTDFTPEMLAFANAKMARNPDIAECPTPLTFLAADTQQLPFADNVFQIVSVAFGLRNVSDYRRGLAEMVRVCRPGGHVAVLEFSMPTAPIFGRVYRAYFRHVLPRIGQILARNKHSAYNYLPQSVAQFPEGQALASVMEASGLQGVTWKPLTFGVATLYHGSKP